MVLQRETEEASESNGIFRRRRRRRKIIIIIRRRRWCGNALLLLLITCFVCCGHIALAVAANWTQGHRARTSSFPAVSTRSSLSQTRSESRMLTKIVTDPACFSFDSADRSRSIFRFVLSYLSLIFSLEKIYRELFCLNGRQKTKREMNKICAASAPWDMRVIVVMVVVAMVVVAMVDPDHTNEKRKK